tara:strand:+ start:999 stop:2798 length:1800 start_codon:yes stop_codon:yes gene_type:complete
VIKKKIRNSLASKLHKISDEIRIDWCYDTYVKLVKYDIPDTTDDDVKGLEKNIDIIHNLFIEESVTSPDLLVFIRNFEIFTKKLYFILDRYKKIDESIRLDYSLRKPSFSKFLTTLNKAKAESQIFEVKDLDQPTICDEVLLRLRAQIEEEGIDEKEKLKLLEKLNKHEKRFSNKKIDRYMLDSLVYRNDNVHQGKDYDLSKKIELFHTIFITELYFVFSFIDELNESFRIESTNTELIQEYVNSKIEQLEQDEKRYVPLSLKNLSDPTKENTFLNEIYKKENQFQIIGKGGNGKTTSLNHLFYQCLKDFKNKNTEMIPVFLNLNKIQEKTSIYIELAKTINTNEEDLRKLIEENKIQLFLDGINEIHSPEIQQQTLQDIDEISKEFPKTKLFITSREQSDTEFLNFFDFPLYQIQELEDKQIENFIIKYCNDSKVSEKVSEIINQQDQSLRLLFRKPLLLSRSIEICKIEPNLPKTEYDIIRIFIDKLLKREKIEKKDKILNVDFYKYILAGVASLIHSDYGLTNISIPKFKFIMLINDAAKNIGYGIGETNQMSSEYIFRISYELEIISFENDDDVKFFHQNYFEFFNSLYIKNYLI